MLSFTSLAQALQSNSSPDRFVSFIESADEESLSYETLLSRAQSLLGTLERSGLKRGDELVLYTKENRNFIIAFWACMLGGIVAVPVATGISDEHKNKLMEIMRTLKRPRLYTDRAALSLLEKYLHANERGDELHPVSSGTIISDEVSETGNPGTIVESGLDDVAFIQFSSGSTRSPKGVVLTNRNVLATNFAMGECYGYTEKDISLSWMPLTHDMGLIGFHINMLVYGMTQHIMSTDLFSRRPLLWMLKVDETRATIICSPNFGFKHYLKLFAEKHSGQMNLDCVRVIVNGAEPISVGLCRQFLKTLAPHGLVQNVMSPSYGLAEAGLSVSLTPPGSLIKTISVDRHGMKVGDKVRYMNTGDADALEFVAEGPVASYCEARIGDLEGKDLGADTMGEVQIRGDNVTAGYYGDPENSSALFTADGWLHTGDLGFIHENEIVITGRLKEVIFVNGKNYYPHDIEATIVEDGQFELGKVVAAGARKEDADEDEILVFILHRGDVDVFRELAAEVKTLISRITGLDLAHVLPVKRIPKTTSGKIQRRFLVDDYLEGNFDHFIQDACAPESPVSETAADYYENLLIEISQRVLPGKQFDRSSNYFEIGASSLDITQIHERFGDLYPDVLDITDFFEYPTVQELAAFIRERREAGSAGNGLAGNVRQEVV